MAEDFLDEIGNAFGLTEDDPHETRWWLLPSQEPEHRADFLLAKPSERQLMSEPSSIEPLQASGERCFGNQVDIAICPDCQDRHAIETLREVLQQ